MSQRAPGDERCKDCGEKREDGRSRCAECAEKRRASEAVRREERKAQAKCVTCGAAVKRTRGAKGKVYTLCSKHLSYYAARTAAAKAAQ